MKEEIKEMRLAGVTISVNGQLKKLSFNDAIYLRDTLITELAGMGEPVYFDSEYVCTTDLLDCHFEVKHDCS
tara:strand:+ start:163 stop:378 length:216 start_codon:yes stop_codon:yes gene_type:complete